VELRKFYNEEAKFIRCDETNNDVVVRAKRMILPLLPKEAIKILDTGCGDGYLVNQLRKKGLDAVGIDLSNERVSYARKRYGNHFGVSSIYELKFEDNYFDLSIASEVIEHLEDPAKALKELKRISKKIILTFPYKEKLIKEVCPHCLKRFYRSGHIQYFDQERIEKLIKQNNLRIIKTKKVAYYPFINFPFLIAWMINKILEILDKTTYIGILCEKN